MEWLTALIQTIGVALGLVPRIVKDLEDPHPELMPAPPPADPGALVHDLEEIRKRKFGK